MRMDGKVALITGAGSGVGRATAQVLAREGAKVVCTDIGDDAGKATVADVVSAGGDGLFLHVDVRSTSEVESAVRAAEEQFGRLDVLIANAGTVGGSAVARPIEELSEEQWLSIIDVNLHGTFRCFKAAIPALRRAGGGAMSATASIAALTGVAGQSAYSASKGGVVALVRSLAYQLAADGIRVNCVCPGGINTNLLRDTDLAAAFETMAEQATSVDPLAVPPGGDPIALMNRAAEPEDVANAHLYLVSDESRLVNGHALVVDAGSMVANTWFLLPR